MFNVGGLYGAGAVRVRRSRRGPGLGWSPLGNRSSLGLALGGVRTLRNCMQLHALARTCAHLRTLACALLRTLAHARQPAQYTLTYYMIKQSWNPVCYFYTLPAYRGAVTCCVDTACYDCHLSSQFAAHSHCAADLL